MATAWSLSGEAHFGDLRVLFVGASSVRSELFAGVSEESGVEVIATDLEGVDAAVERLRPDVLVSDLDAVGEDAFHIVERMRSLSEDAGGAVVAIAVGDTPSDTGRALAAGYESYCSRESVASEVVDLVEELRRDAAVAAHAASFRGKQIALRSRLVERSKELRAQRDRLARSAERVEEQGRPRERVATLLVRAPAGAVEASANRLLRGLPEREAGLLLPSLSLVRLAAGRTLYMEGSRIDAVYFPITCVVSQASLTRDGKIFEISSIGNEGMVGLGAALDADRASCWTRVQVPGAAFRIVTPALVASLDECPQLASAIRRYAEARIFDLMQNALCNRLHRVDGQLAKTLLTMSERVRSLELPMTHERLAEALGITRPSVTLAAQALEDAGAIARSYGRIRIVDADRLRLAACECYESVRAELDHLLPCDAAAALQA